ncbi:MAG: hypothetical protein ACFFD3_06180 [Candidatus Thorarchaeota archaeon]
MAEIALETVGRIHFLGGTVYGDVAITSKFQLNFTEIHLALKAYEKTRIRFPATHVSGEFFGGEEVSRVFSESYLHYRNEIVLNEEGHVNSNTIRVPFSIRIPIEAPPTFRCEMARVEYTLEARVISPHAPDHTAMIPLIVRDAVGQINSNPIIRQEDWLTLMLDSDSFCIEQPLRGKIMIPSIAGVDGVDFEIILTEEAMADNQSREMSYPVVIGHLVKEDITKETWIGFEFDIERNVQPSISGKLFSASYDLKAILRKRLGIDRSLTIPIRIVHCQTSSNQDVAF